MLLDPKFWGWVERFNEQASDRAQTLQLSLREQSAGGSAALMWQILFPIHVPAARVEVVAVSPEECDAFERAFSGRYPVQAKRALVEILLRSLRGKVGDRREDLVVRLLEETVPSGEDPQP